MRPVNEGLVSSDAVPLPMSVSPADRRSAAITATEAAIAGDWTDELGDVLDALDLRGGLR